MKYKDKTMPVRHVNIWEPKVIGNDKIQMTLVYEVNSKDVVTFIRQPVTLSACGMRYLGGEFHKLLDELEDRLHEARDHMKGTR